MTIKEATAKAAQIVKDICDQNSITPLPEIQIRQRNLSNPMERNAVTINRKSLIVIDFEYFDPQNHNDLHKTIAHELAHYVNHDHPSLINVFFDLIYGKFSKSLKCKKRNTSLIINIATEIRADIVGAQLALIDRPSIISAFDELVKTESPQNALEANFRLGYPSYAIRKQLLENHEDFTADTLQEILGLYSAYHFDQNAVTAFF